MGVVQLDVEAAKLKIRNLDLSFVEQRLIRVDGHTAAQAAEAVEEYRCFLQLHAECPEQIIVPPRAADHAWHNHILHTQRYMDDMQAIFGRMVHHHPQDSIGAAYEQACEFTRQAFLTQFGRSVAEFEICWLNDPSPVKRAA